MNYKEWCNLKANDINENIFPKSTKSDEAIAVLRDYLIDENWYVNYPADKGQIITEIIAEIMLTRSSAKYRSYPWYKKLYINIKCLFTDKHLYEYY